MTPQAAEFRNIDFTRARFVESDFTDVVMRGVEIRRTDIDAPWLFEPPNAFVINGVDVIGYVDAELNGRFPGRELRRTGDPAGLQAAWAAVEQAWGAVLDRAAALPIGTVDVSLNGEWSFAQTLRHLVLATDAWLGRAIRENDAFHPLGIPDVSLTDELGSARFRTDQPAYEDVLEARAGRMAMVQDFIASVTAEELAILHPHPWGSQHQESTLKCLHVILQEEWDHLRFATRDLDTLAARPTPGPSGDQ